jgi:hypothetical protein
MKTKRCNSCSYTVSLKEDSDIFYAQKHKTLTMLSFRPGNISSTLVTTIFGTLAERDWRPFLSLKLVLHTCMKVGYENPIDIAPEALKQTSGD